MVEKSHTAGPAAAWWPSFFEPLRGIGERVADFFAPLAEAAATSESYEIHVELPGVSSEEIDVGAHEHVLTVSGEKRPEHESAGRTFFFSERSYGSFQRSFRLPPDADTDKITADLRDGVLSLKVPKLGPPPEERRKIKVRVT